MTENWRQIKEYPDYMVSDQGRVVSLNFRRSGNPKLLSPSMRGGYSTVSIHGKRFNVHTLVAMAFLGKPKGERTRVRHKNHDRSDNRPCNLAWCTNGEAVSTAWKDGQYQNVAEEMKKKRIPIVSYEPTTGERRFFESISDASDALRVDKRKVSQVLKGKRKMTGGYMFIAA